MNIPILDIIRTNHGLQYGARKSFALTDSALTRTRGAVGKLFTPSVGAVVGANDFEYLEPWSKMRLCNLADNGTVNAYSGDAGYATDGTNGQVMVEIPRFWYRVEKADDSWEWIVSPIPQPGFSVHPAFVSNGVERSRLYVSAYLGAEVTGALVSVTNTLPQYDKTRAQFRTLARARGANWGIMDFTTYSALQLLMLVMTANFDMQTVIGKGISDMRYNSGDVATVNESAVNRVIVANATAGYFAAGNMIGIGTTLGGNQVAKFRQISSIDVYDGSNKAITFDGAAVNVAIGNIVYTMPSKTGGADALGIHTGRAMGTDWKVDVSFFGMQGLWGNFFQFLDGWNMDASYYAWLNDNPATCADATFVAPYKRYGAVMPSAADGYARRFGYDSAYPWTMLTGEVGGASTGPVGDYLYRSATASERVLLVGGNWITGAADGPWYWSLAFASSIANWHYGARLLYKPG